MRITIVTFAWPPRNVIGTHRPYSWAKYMSMSGIQVRVLTAKKYSFDEPLDSELPDLKNVEVIETDYLTKNISVLVKSYVFQALKKVVPFVIPHIRKAAVIGGNPRDQWLDSIRPTLQSMANSCDVVISTFSPDATHVIASEMKSYNPKLLWVADYRDLWSGNHLVDRSSDEKENVERLEHNTVGVRADLITTVSDELANVLVEKFDKPTSTITNGFDLSRAALDRLLNSKIRRESGNFDIVYTGKIYEGFRDPTPLIKELLLLEKENVFESGKVIVHFYGGQAEDLNWIDVGEDFDHLVRFHGHVAREVALKAQKDACMLLLLESPLKEASGVLTGKVFEYIASGVPVLSLGSLQSSAIAKLLKQTGTGMCAESSSKRIRIAIESMLNDGTPNWFSPKAEEIMKYSRKNQSDALLELISNVKNAQKKEFDE